MLFIREVRQYGTPAIGAVWLFMCLAQPVAAQSADPNPGALHISGASEISSAYLFRGIRREDENLILWPSFDLGIALHSGDGLVTALSANIGTWNSLHRGLSGSSGPAGKLWYESDFYATLGVGFSGGWSVGATYTAYTSPNNMFSTIKEMAFKASANAKGFRPYALLGFEFDTAPGAGQADDGEKAGRYLELGAAPGFTRAKVGLSVPVKVGLSAGSYYEQNTGTSARPLYVDSTFGYFSVAGIGTVPLGGTTQFGQWNVHGGVEFQKLGDTTAALNDGDSTAVIVSGGIGFVY